MLPPGSLMAEPSRMGCSICIAPAEDTRCPASIKRKPMCIIWGARTESQLLAVPFFRMEAAPHTIVFIAREAITATEAQSHQLAEAGAWLIQSNRAMEFMLLYSCISGIWRAPARKRSICAARSQSESPSEPRVLNSMLLKSAVSMVNDTTARYQPEEYLKGAASLHGGIYVYILSRQLIMYTYAKTIVRILAVVLIMALAAESALAAEKPVISNVEIKGLGRVDPGTILPRLTQQPGQRLSPEGVTEDIKTIFSMGYFEDVASELVVEEGGLKLLYRVREKPAIRRVDFYGNSEVSDEKIEKAINISSGSMSDKILIAENAEAVRGVLSEEGFPRATVVPVLREVSSGNVLLTYVIEEGPEVRIDEISFTGNEVYTDRELRGRMETSEWGIFSWLTGSGYLKRDELRADMGRLQSLYHDHGYIKADISEPSIKYKDGNQWLDINMSVIEGDRYRVSTVSFSGSTILSEKDMAGGLKTRAGQILNRSFLMEDVKTLTGMFTSKGYALATVRPDFRLNEEDKSVDIAFRITEGDIYRVGRIEIEGNYKTRDHVIRREVRLNEGDIFDSEKLQKSFRALANLNFFSDLKLNPKPDARRKALDIEVEVEEKLTGSFNVGGGYSSVDKFMGMVDMTFGNLGGRGQYLKLLSRFSSVTTTYEIEFRDPWIFNRPVSFSSSIYRTDREYDDYDTFTQGFSLGLGKRFGEYWSVGSSYRYDNVTVRNIRDNASSLIRSQEGKTTTSSISPYISRDSRDNFMMPHEGTRNRLDFTYAGLGGDNKYMKLSLESQVVLPVTARTELSLRGRYGYAVGLGDDPLPIYERFRVGSVYTVRGLRDIGPRDEFGNYIGGGQRLIFNADYTIPATEAGAFKWVVFWDAGTAFDKEINLRYTAGAGFKWFAPIGPISLVWAKNLYPQEGESSYRWEFAVGSMF